MKAVKPAKASRRSTGASQTFVTWAGAIALLALVAAAYWPTLDNGFIWDDGAYILNNTTLRTPGGLVQMWTNPSSIPQYYPLVHTTFWIEYQLWGDAPRGYHVVNLLLQALNAVLVWRLLARLQVPGAWLAAAIFAVHPVHVETVAWVTERKNVLSLGLALGSLLAFLRFLPAEQVGRERSPGESKLDWRWYALSLGLYLGALLSKTVTASVPAVLLVIYWWKAGRIEWRKVACLIPFFALGLSLASMTVWLERAHVGAQGEEWNWTPVERLLIAGRAVWFYAGKLVWPRPLVFFYPRWTIDAQAVWQWLFPAGAALLVIVLWLLRKRIGRGPLAAVLIFGGVLMPALGFFNVYPFRYSFVADHFQYHASVALIALLAAVAVWLTTRLSRDLSWFPLVASLGLLIPLIALARERAPVYHDVRSLWEDTLVGNPTSWAARTNLADYLLGQEKPKEALEAYFEALRDAPPQAAWQIHLSIGNILQETKQPDLALPHYVEALRLCPANTRWAVEINLASNLMDQKRFEEAMQHYRVALATNAADLNDAAHLNIAICLDELGQSAAAAGHFRQAFQMNPQTPWPIFLRAGQCLLRAKLPRDAADVFRHVLVLQPAYLPARTELAKALLADGKLDAAASEIIANLKTQLKDPDRAQAHVVYGHILRKQGQDSEARRQYQIALEVVPDYAEAKAALAETPK